ncbi:MAG: glycoside hydrolase family 43 protein [Muribaculaceae bacterium]|nr:glycoside hydrolase family 43 protein [Muribaculaceae bacterium]
MRKHLATTVAISLAAMCCSSMQAANVAEFDCFAYNGHDACYENITLDNPGDYLNPILPGWYSDPSICTNGKGDYFLVTSTFVYYPGVPIFHSRDMVNWRQIGHVLNRQSQLKNFPGQHVSGGIFAPAISYNPANGTYYMITTNVGAGNFFVKTTDPFSGEWSEPIYLPEVQGIDPAFFFDEDGKGYIVNNDDAPDYKPEYPGHRTVRVVEFDPATDRCVGERKIVVNKGWRPQDKPIWCEGPHIYKINGQYYLMTAEGGTAENHSEVIYRADSPFGPYTPFQGNPILTQRDLDRNRPNPVTCAGHADLIQTAEGDWWAVFLACRPNAAGYENLGRETFMLPVEWTADGWPIITRDKELVAPKGTRAAAVRAANPTFGNFGVRDEFNDAQPDQEWITLRTPATDLYTIADGKLCLQCAAVNAGEKLTPAMLARRVQHTSFDASTSLEFTPETTDECAGLIIYKDETHHYLLGIGKDADGKRCVFLDRVTPEGCTTMASVPLKGKKVKPVELRTSSNDDGTAFSFAYSTDGGKKWHEVGTPQDARLTSTAQAGGFTGTVVGPYATSKRYSYNNK